MAVPCVWGSAFSGISVAADSGCTMWLRVYIPGISVVAHGGCTMQLGSTFPGISLATGGGCTMHQVLCLRSWCHCLCYSLAWHREAVPDFITPRKHTGICFGSLFSFPITFLIKGKFTSSKAENGVGPPGGLSKALSAGKLDHVGQCTWSENRKVSRVTKLCWEIQGLFQWQNHPK